MRKQHCSNELVDALKWRKTLFFPIPIWGKMGSQCFRRGKKIFGDVIKSVRNNARKKKLVMGRFFYDKKLVSVFQTKEYWKT